MSHLELKEQEIIRRESLKKLRDAGIDPYPAAEYKVNATSRDIKDKFDDSETEHRNVSIAGRIMGRRIMGNASFVELQDSEGRIQLYLSQTKFVREKIKPCTTMFSKNSSIAAILLVLKVLCLKPKWVKSRFM